jgi:predicted enzyme related to lactoylglutathione lyase
MTEARMQETPEYAPGTFCWVELSTSDSDAAKKFYSELFGWTFQDLPMGPGSVYTMLQSDGKEVGGLFQLTDEMKSAGIRPNWMSYISVENADDSAAKAKGLGATLMKEPFDVMTVGRMSVVQDPTGACFALWQAGAHKGAGISNVPNSWCWNELGTRDSAKAGDFYTGLFGWGKKVQQMGPMTYTSFTNGDKPIGGMYELSPEMANVPPHWLSYFAVTDTDAAVNKATGLGATVISPPMDIPGTGRFAIIQDPHGAAFGIIKLEYPQA